MDLACFAIQNRAENKSAERDHHPCAASADRVKRARPAATAELHPETEQERPDRRRDTKREDIAVDAGAPCDQRKADKNDKPDQQELRTQPCPAAGPYEMAPSRGEAERGVIERETAKPAKQAAKLMYDSLLGLCEA